MLKLLMLTFYLGRLDGKCTEGDGLPCYSVTTLSSESSYLIETTKCGKNNKYPNNEFCTWYFDVSECYPSISCSYFDVKGSPSPSTCNKGDKMTIDLVEFDDDLKVNFCGDLGSLSYSSDSDSLLYFDISFESNRKRKGKGFSCTVSCNGTSPEATTPTTTTTTKTTTTTTTTEITETTEVITNPPGGFNCMCGVPNRVTKIIGGITTKENEYPWQVGLYFGSSDSPSCGGSIISDETILTAAHCTEGRSASNIDVVVGDHDWSVADLEKRVSVCNIIKHPFYDGSSSIDYDYSLLILCSPLTFKREVQPVCLPTQSGSLYENIEATVSGWGTTETGQLSKQLKAANVTTIPNSACNENYNPQNEEITDNMICAKKDDKDACQGDSGGPLIADEPQHDHSVIIGVVSWGIGCALADFPGVYSRVTAQIDFIKDNMTGNICPVPN